MILYQMLSLAVIIYYRENLASRIVVKTYIN